MDTLTIMVKTLSIFASHCKTLMFIWISHRMLHEIVTLKISQHAQELKQIVTKDT